MGKYKINLLDTLLILFWIAIVGIYVPNPSIYYIYQGIITIIVFLISISEIKNLFLQGEILILSGIIVISCILNRNQILYTQVIRGIVYGLLIVDMFIFLKKYIKIRGAYKLIENFYKISKVYFVINLIWIFILLINGNLIECIQNEKLFLGGKFPTVYSFIFYLMFFCMYWSGNKVFPFSMKKKLFLFISIICIWMSYLLQASTGIIAITIFVLLELFGEKIVSFMNKPMMIILLLVISFSVIFFLNIILNNSLVQYIIIDILHEDLGLTGRMQLYKLLYNLLHKAGIFGNGFGSYVTSTLEYHGWANSQNGLAEIILTYGYAGAIAFIAIIFESYRKNKMIVNSLSITIITFIIVAVVEIPYDAKFLLLVILLRIIDCRQINSNFDFPRKLKIRV